MPAASEHISISLSVASGRTRQQGFGVPLFAATFAGASRQYGPFYSALELETADLGSTVAEAWAAVLCAQEPAPRAFMIGRIDAGDADIGASLTAIEAAAPASFYALNIESRVEAVILAARTWIDTRRKVAIVQSDDAGILAGTAGNVALDLQTAATNRMALCYHTDDAEYLDAAVTARMCALDLDVRNGVGPMAYKQFVGIPTANDLTSAQADAIEAAGANWYDLASSSSGVDLARFFYPGTMASGRFIDTQLSVDWTASRLEEAAIREFIRASAGNGTGIPFDDGGLAYLAGVLQDVLVRGADYGHFKRITSAGRATPFVEHVPLAELGEQDIEDRTARFRGAAVFRGSVQKINPLDITLSFS